MASCCAPHSFRIQFLIKAHTQQYPARPESNSQNVHTQQYPAKLSTRSSNNSIIVMTLIRMSTQQLLQPWASLVGYNQQPPICLRHSSRCRRPAFVLSALWSRRARASRAGPWRVRGAWGRGPGAVGGGRFCWQLPPTPSPPPIAHIVWAVLPPPASGPPPLVSRSCCGSACGVCARRGLLGWWGDRLAGGTFWRYTPYILFTYITGDTPYIAYADGLSNLHPLSPIVPSLC